ncbi:MAG: 50S ribosomal protein L23 [Candidatus Liptonbacteria bacterium]|nr:50S ribosomal protein L23 [Candidatus Liptonbacteria bacterium]
MKNISIVKKPHITEKATDLSKEGKYVFIVEPSSSKNEIKKAIKRIYGVDVLKIQTIVRHPKLKRFRNKADARAGYKKAVVTLKEGQKIETN